MKIKVLLMLIILFSLVVRFYNLTELPGEWYGDISNVHEYVTEILELKWPFYFLQSPGPFYHYLIVPLVLLFKDLGYETYKYSSAIVSILGLIGIYFFASEFSNKKAALITVLLSSFSLWYLISSRLGNSQIVIPAYIAFSTFYYLRFTRNKKNPDLILTVLTASTGWYIYPQTFVFPPFIFLMLFLFIIFGEGKKYLSGGFLIFASTAIIGILPLFLIFKNQEKNFAGNFSADGYLGEKIFPVFSMPYGEFAAKLGDNLSKTYLMLHTAGDSTFRVNISGQRQIDAISGSLFILGIIFMLRKFSPGKTAFVILAFMILPLPSVSPAIPPSEIPNSARTIALIPFVYLLVALGIWQMFVVLKKADKLAACAVISVLIVIIANNNLTDYFFAYASGLPENNLGPSRYIAEYIDKNVPENTNLYFAECCWGNAGEPEPKGVIYSLRKKRIVVLDRVLKSCNEITRPAAVVFDDFENVRMKIGDCLIDTDENLVYSKNRDLIARIIFID